MKSKRIQLPVLGAIAATRGMLGFGAGLLASRRIARRRRKVVGWTLLGLGVVSTIPLAAMVFRSRSEPGIVTAAADAASAADATLA